MLKRRYRLDLLLFVLASILAVACAVAAEQIWGVPRGWAFFGGVVLLSLGLSARQMLAPPPFDFTVEGQHIEFEFADPEYAMVFRAQNEILGTFGLH